MRTYLQFLLASIILILMPGCDNNVQVHTVEASFGSWITSNSPSTEFMEYWYNGTAEISSYSLKQERYGEIREGDAVLIFVTEPFSMKKQVKLDNPQQAGNDKVSVLKLNQVRKFNTGIYDYSTMTSTFTPVDLAQYPNTIKTTTSSQEWCGHTFTQLNLAGSKYRYREYSYFESEGDIDQRIKATLLEDELLSRIRITGSLPVGHVDIIPSTTHSRFVHRPLKAERANITKFKTDEYITYDISYDNIDRNLTVKVEPVFPHKIYSWTEKSSRGVTTATIKKTLNTPYWSKNSNSDEILRQELGLTK